MAESTLKSICPIFQVADLDRALEFYTKVLGFDVGWIAGTPPQYACVCREGVEIQLNVFAQPVLSHAYVHLTGINAYYQRAVGAGAKIVVAMDDREYGMRDARIADPDGNQLSIGEEIALH
jgi:predicted enzyme related to lactoylglutathione lyase